MGEILGWECAEKVISFYSTFGIILYHSFPPLCPRLTALTGEILMKVVLFGGKIGINV
jgi:hypothetical protein